MAYKNNIMIVRHRLLTELVKLWKDGMLVEKIDRLPIELSALLKLPCRATASKISYENRVIPSTSFHGWERYSAVNIFHLAGETVVFSS